MPASTGSCSPPRLLAVLANALGPSAARRELKWMRNAIANPPPGLALPALSAMVARRARGEPLQYILGTQPFGSLDILVRPPVLIPRPETEHWTIRLSEALAPSPDAPVRVLDLCTGSGCIPLLLCALWPLGSTRAVGVDISLAALQLATENARHLSHASAPSVPRNTFRSVWGDLRAPLHLASALPHKPFSLLTANPPYIPPPDYAVLPRSVRAYEDRRALLGGGQDGLALYRSIAQFVAAPGVLAPGGSLALEVGDGQAPSVRDILSRPRLFAKTEIWQDPWGKERVVLGWQRI
ncbi:S-adenosyl-L-methionine-dependent methyltransferase [Amylostereum chailletii]|nr:S-adenosyl-L-methionine-dependent methyltransferase [Amylostereum chailletii]